MCAFVHPHVCPSFECFLMKSLRHPNIVKLVGVCWDDIFACCLEFISNGSLEDHFRKCRGTNHGSMTWKDQLLRTSTECALGVQYLHHERYWSEEEEVEDVEGELKVVPAGYRECIIHRDLKPDNMLLTDDWKLKLTDFGEARAVQLNQTMTSVGTPIYVAPEVMKGYRYGATADSYSFGICLVAMIRADKDIIEFYIQALRKKMKRKTKAGVGITILNTRMYTKGWRPLLPLPFKKSYPKLCGLIYKCWSQVADERPLFDEIVGLLQGSVGDEVRKRGEPVITYLSKLPDAQYLDEMRMEAEGGIVIDDDEEDEAGGMDTTRFVSRRQFDEVLEELESLKTQRLKGESGGEGRRGTVVSKRELENMLLERDKLKEELERLK